MSLTSSRLTVPSEFLSAFSNATCSVRSPPRGAGAVWLLGCCCRGCGCVVGGCALREAGCWLGCWAIAAAVMPIATKVANASFFTIMAASLLRVLNETPAARPARRRARDLLRDGQRLLRDAQRA